MIRNAHTENRDDILSPEERVNTLLNGASIEIEKAENLIFGIHSDKGLSLDLKPPGAHGGRPFGSKEQSKKLYMDELIRLRTNTKAEAYKMIENSSPALKQKISAQIDKWQNPDYKEKTDEKNIDQSQEFILRGGAVGVKKEIEPKIEAEPSKPKDVGMSMSTTFFTSLNYYKIQEDPDEPTGQTDISNEIDLDKD